MYIFLRVHKRFTSDNGTMEFINKDEKSKYIYVDLFRAGSTCLMLDRSYFYNNISEKVSLPLIKYK